MTPELEAKRGFIAAFFDEAEARHAFLAELHDNGHGHEAMTLCLTYIDSFAQWLCWPSHSTGRNFVTSLTSFGGDPLLSLIHPLQASRAFVQMRPSWQAIGGRLKAAFPGSAVDLMSEAQFLAALTPHFNQAEIRQMSAEIWRGSVAAVAYFRLRNPSVHGFGAASSITFDRTSYQGQVVSELDFQRLHKAARPLIVEARRRSESTIQWFGDDAIVS